jgi:RND family efflux transporter MFP subunit
MKRTNACVAFTPWSAVALCGLALAGAQAADRPANFEVSDEQVQALDIQTAPIQGHSEAIRASFPAQVVVPTGAEQVVSSPVAGLVAQLLVEQFQPVRAGTPLVRIASPELGQLQLQLLQASSRATLARQAAQREQQLFDEGIIPQRRVQESWAALKEAEAALAQATAALRLSGLSAAAINGVTASGEPVDSVTLTAGRAGIVTEIAVKPGQRVEDATALVHVSQTDPLWLEIQLPAAEGMNWPPETRVEVPDRGITARVVSVSPTVAASSQTLVLRAVVEEKAGALRPGELVTVALPTSAAESGWDVPLAAVAHDGKQAYVFVRTPGGFEARAVNVIASAGQRSRVQGALKAGEQLAVSGIVALKGAWLSAGEAE